MNSLHGSSLGSLGSAPLIAAILGAGAMASELYQAKDYINPDEYQGCPPGEIPTKDGGCVSVGPAPSTGLPPPEKRGGGGGGGGGYVAPVSTVAPSTAPPPPVESSFPWKWALAGLLAFGAVGAVIYAKSGNSMTSNEYDEDEV